VRGGRRADHLPHPLRRANAPAWGHFSDRHHARSVIDRSRHVLPAAVHAAALNAKE
jgi:hypothetical protein